jgi:hypothetical protein
MLSGAVAGYCFLRIFFYPILNFLVDETELYSNPKHQKAMNVFYHARLYPRPIWNDEKRSAWIRAWWKYAMIGLTSFIILAVTLYIHDTIKLMIDS